MALEERLLTALLTHSLAQFGNLKDQRQFVKPKWRTSEMNLDKPKKNKMKRKKLLNNPGPLGDRGPFS